MIFSETQVLSASFFQALPQKNRSRNLSGLVLGELSLQLNELLSMSLSLVGPTGKKTEIFQLTFNWVLE